ncbi:MAG: YkvA family protein [Candidatus Heimdallarchaeaceae archaeon]
MDNGIDFEKKEGPKNKSYHYHLKHAVDNYQDDEDILKYLPDFYQLLCNIGCNNKSQWYTKMLVNAALSYLVLEEDIIPDKEGKDGYLDDLYICAYVLKEIRDKVSKNIILDNIGDLDFEDDIFQLIYDVVNRASDILEDKTEKILDIVGFSKFTLFDFLYDQDKTKTLMNRKEKRRLLYAMLAVKADSKLKIESSTHQMTTLRSLIRTHHEFGEIKRYMEFIHD